MSDVTAHLHRYGIGVADQNLPHQLLLEYGREIDNAVLDSEGLDCGFEPREEGDKVLDANLVLECDIGGDGELETALQIISEESSELL